MNRISSHSRQSIARTLILGLISSFAVALSGPIEIASAGPTLSWTTSTLSQKSYGPAIATNYDGTKVFVGGTSGGYLSSDSGATWSAVAALANVNTSSFTSVGMSSDGNKIYYAFSNKFYYSWDGGATWTGTLTNSLNRELWQISTSTDGSKIVMASRDGGLYSYSTNSGQTWNSVSDSLGGGWAGAVSGDGTKMVIANSKLQTARM